MFFIIEEFKMVLASFTRLDPVNNVGCYLGEDYAYLCISPPERLGLLP